MIRLAAFNAAWYQVEQSLLEGGSSSAPCKRRLHRSIATNNLNAK